MAAMDAGEMRTVGEDPSVVATIRGGDEGLFGALLERHRRELRVHCYRMLGSLEDAEDVVQETFAKAWRGRASFDGRATFRAWLYRIATNACLDAIRRRQRRVVESTWSGGGPSLDEVPWLQPIPDDLLDGAAPATDEPEAVAVARETIELAFLAAIQHLAPRPRAVLILRDVLGWSPSETAAALDDSVTAVNSALQRARARLQQLGRPDQPDWAATAPPSDEELVLLRRYVDAHARADAAAVIELLDEQVRFTMPTIVNGVVQEVNRFDGRDAVGAFFLDLLGAGSPGDWRLVPIRANRQPAAANYVRPWGESTYRGVTLDVLRIENGALVEITTFDAGVFPSFGLPLTL
jgi:RNA polymerase sigma-70 factor, ECF subfamily